MEMEIVARNMVLVETITEMALMEKVQTETEMETEI